MKIVQKQFYNIGSRTSRAPSSRPAELFGSSAAGRSASCLYLVSQKLGSVTALIKILICLGLDLSLNFYLFVMIPPAVGNAKILFNVEITDAQRLLFSST